MGSQRYSRQIKEANRRAESRAFWKRIAEIRARKEAREREEQKSSTPSAPAVREVNE